MFVSVIVWLGLLVSVLKKWCVVLVWLVGSVSLIFFLIVIRRIFV